MSLRSATRVLLIVTVLLFAQSATAHEGPPFPLVVDQATGRYVVSIWTDPDVGTALFFVIVRTQDGSEPPADLRVQIGVQPVSGRLAETFHSGQREKLQGQVQYRTQVQFDAPELWRVRVRLESPQGNAETIATVEATPPGYGRWDLLVYLLPFVAVGILWTIAILRKLKRRTGDNHA